MDEQEQSITFEGFGNLPDMECRVRPDGRVEWRYKIEGGEFPGFDGFWRIMPEWEMREHLRLGGRIADWLRSLDEVNKKRGQ